MSGDVGEANIFTVNPAGVKVHWKLLHDMTEEQVKQLISNVGRLSATLAEKGYTPDPFGGKYGPAGPAGAASAPAPNAAPNDAQGPAPRCRDCGGEVYDDRGNRRTPKAPHFKCKDKANCGAVGWLSANGIDWQKARQPANSGQRY